MPSLKGRNRPRHNGQQPSSVFQRFGRKVRFRLLWVFVAYGIGASSTWYFRQATFRFLFAPAKGNLSPFGGLPIFTGPSEMMGATIHLALLGGVIVAFPVATVGIYQLLSPLLGRKRRRFIVLFLPVVFACYLSGVAFAYFVMLPVGLKFLLKFGTGIAIPLISITEYMSLVTAVLIWIGVVFELPLVMFLLTKLRLVRYERFRKFQKYLPGAAFVLGALLTPTFDVVNQSLVALPIIVLFEVGLFLSWMARPKAKGYKNIWQKAKGAAASMGQWLWTVFLVLAKLARRAWRWFIGRW